VAIDRNFPEVKNYAGARTCVRDVPNVVDVGNTCVCVYVRYGFAYSKFLAATIKNRRESQFSDAIEMERFAGFHTTAAAVRRFVSRVSTIRFISVGYIRARRQYVGM